MSLETIRPVIVVGADHGGLAQKEALRSWLSDEGYQVQDCGAFTLDPDDDYPVIAEAVVKNVLAVEAKGGVVYGILVCRSGAGMVMAANRFPAIRAVAAFTPQQAAHARAHNDANVLALSGDWMDQALMRQCIETFLQTPFSSQARHSRRRAQLSALNQ